MVIALILPVLLTTIDGLARARRRGYSIARSLVWVLVAALPFLLGLGLAVVAKLLHALSATPPGPLGAGAVPLGGGGVAVLLLIAGVIVAALFAWTPIARGLSGVRRSEIAAGQGAAAATLLVMCVTTIIIWVHNPVAAALVVPALHLWMWIVDPDVPLPRAGVIAFIAVGLAAPILVVAYYASTLGLGPLDVVWNGLLVVAGGHIGVPVAVEWSLLLGCLASVVAIAVRGQRMDRPEQTPVTVRGPITYAGPGSLGGTDSALRARR
jgi:type IV secretory pathway VirB3-like protein